MRSFHGIALFVLVALTGFGRAGLASQQEDGKRLANILIAARQAVSQHADFIADPTKSAVATSKILEETKAIYPRNTGEDLNESEGENGKLLSAIGKVIDGAKRGKFRGAWEKDAYPGKFLPARFAREVADEFNRSTDGRYLLRLTTLDQWLVNKRQNSPDDWERAVLKKYESKEVKPWTVYFEKSSYQGKKAARVLKVEFFQNSCLKCHGGEAGTKLHPSKLPGKLDDIGGAVSVVLFD